jgi:hypothetical protein
MPRQSRHNITALDELAVRIVSEFDDQPGLRLTFWQIRRLWDVPEIECEEALAYLTRTGRLWRDPSGRYCLVRVTV